MPHTMIKSAGRRLSSSCAAKARKSSLRQPRRDASTMAIADIDKLAPRRKGYNRLEAPPQKTNRERSSRNEDLSLKLCEGNGGCAARRCLAHSERQILVVIF